jgi:D-sedoheptulose 7-phosphate isomerase
MTNVEAAATGLPEYLNGYLRLYTKTLESLPVDAISGVAELVKKAHTEGRRIFIMGNGGAAASASHFATDMGKGASDHMGKRFKIIALTDNVGWITAIGNDYRYEDIFRRQLENHAEPGDVLISVSVSGDSSNLVEALSWAKENGLSTVALVGAKRGRTAAISEHVVAVEDTHYGRVEDAHMTILHMLANAFMENAWG